MIDTSFDSGSATLTATAYGEISHEDYQDRLTPAMEEALNSADKINLLYVFTADYEGFSRRAMRDDARLGMAHRKDFKRIGVVADQTWIRNAVSAFAIFIPAEIRVFELSDLAVAEAWVREA